MVSLHRRIKRARRRVGGLLLRTCGPQTLAWLSGTWQGDIVGREHFDRARTHNGCLVAMWHGRMIVPVSFFREGGLHVLVSPSEDGDLSEGMLERFGYEVVRGSSSRGGARALRTMLEKLDRGGVVIITPDGPRGPMHSVNLGLAWMGRATDRPILTFGAAADRAWHVNSWDRFTIPKPRARIAMTFGAPIVVPREGGDDALVRATDQIREGLFAAERASFARLGQEPDW